MTEIRTLVKCPQCNGNAVYVLGDIHEATICDNCDFCVVDVRGDMNEIIEQIADNYDRAAKLGDYYDQD